MQSIPIKTYAAYSLDDAVRSCSSSGAIFSLLAELILDRQGVVYGVKMSADCYGAEFTSVTDRAELGKLRGSKYLQAKVGDTYRKVRRDLQVGKTVLFTGTGCQVNGLKGLLGQDYDNLICVDVICHGVPSPALWRKYVASKEQQQGEKLKRVNFRCKDLGWSNFGVKEVFQGIVIKEEYIPLKESSYMQMFLHNYSLRPSCYQCRAKKEKQSDVTIADFWGINDVAVEMNDELGVSLVLIRSKKGEKVIGDISKGLCLKEVSYEAGVKKNPSEYYSVAKPPQREAFFKDMTKISYLELSRKYLTTKKRPFKAVAKKKIKAGLELLFRE
ncbi:coenzyme F420-reducing hydrogenase beta subunit [Lachnospiraceae bacterium PM6-15]|uniref:Coenzyme F420 hydrogenase/dehydrogenase, beta subunit C-terminal domain n=1 Tax=Ohessyouella blattaphilus TaxID=2949333 RepID=UPI003E1FDCD8